MICIEKIKERQVNILRFAEKLRNAMQELDLNQAQMCGLTGKSKAFLESLGIDSTLESAINMAMIKKALKGDVKAYEAVARFAGQYEVPDEEIREKEADIELKRARKQQITGENETDEALDRLDAILKEMRDNAVKQETE